MYRFLAVLTISSMMGLQAWRTLFDNFAVNVARRFECVIGIRYSDDADRAIEVIKKLVEEHPLALINPAPVAFVDSLGDSSVTIIVRIWTPATEWFGVKMELLWKIKQALEKEGIQIPFPQRVLWFANELTRGETRCSGSGDNEIQGNP